MDISHKNNFYCIPIDSENKYLFLYIILIHIYSFYIFFQDKDICNQINKKHSNRLSAF